MKRFIDLTGQVTLNNDRYFAWIDTSNDHFETHSGNQIWESWNDFAEDYEDTDLERYNKLCPDWVFQYEWQREVSQDANESGGNKISEAMDDARPD